MAHLDAEELYQQACGHARQTALLASVESLLGWDERTMLPAEAGSYRAEQMALLSGMVHRANAPTRLRPAA